MNACLTSRPCIELKIWLTQTISEWNFKFKITVHQKQIAQSNLKCVGYYTLFYLKLPNNSFSRVVEKHTFEDEKKRNVILVSHIYH